MARNAQRGRSAGAGGPPREPWLPNGGQGRNLSRPSCNFSSSSDKSEEERGKEKKKKKKKKIPGESGPASKMLVGCQPAPKPSLGLAPSWALTSSGSVLGP